MRKEKGLKMPINNKLNLTLSISSFKILVVFFFITLMASSSVARDEDGISSIILSKEKLESLQNTLQAEYQEIKWRILSVSQPLATEIFVSIEVDDKTASAYSDPNGNRVIFGHAVMCPNLDEPRWKFIDKETDVLFLMFYKGKMIFPPDLHTNRMTAGCRYSKSLVKSMIKQGAIQLKIHEKGK
jgi:hypothetical protein